MSKGLLISRRNKLKLEKISIQNPIDQNKTFYKNYKNMYNKLLKKAKKLYFESAFDANRNDLKKTWKLLREAIDKTKDGNSSVEKIRSDGDLFENKEDIANLFNDYFTNVAESIAKEINPTTSPPDNFLPKNIDFNLNQIGPIKLIDIVTKLENKFSTDKDNISNDLLKKVIVNIAVPLSHIFNLSLESGYVPDQLKVAKVVPIFKVKHPTADEHLSMNSYRPISLLPIYSKVLEKLVADQLNVFLKENNLLYEHQYGYQNSKSTYHPMIHLLNKVSEAANKGEFTIGVFCDLQKAFDTCSHTILLKKLEKLGVRNKELSWFKSYLDNRKQFVCIQGTYSVCLPITKGVPQGSILGPILFLIYINDLKDTTNLFSLLFADDTSFLISGKDINIVVDTLNVELHKVCTWFRANELSLHPKKTKFMIFTQQETKFDFNNINIILNYNNSDQTDPLLINRLDYVNSGSTVPAIKFLGVYIDPKLNFQYHMNKICKKISSSLYVIKRSKNLLSGKALLTLYYSMIHCHLTYCIQIWSCGSPSSFSKLFLLQKKAIRIITNSPYNAHTEPLFKSTKILPLRELSNLTKLQFIFSYKNGLLPSSFDGIWIFNHERQNELELRNASDLYVPTARLKSVENFPLFAFPKIWNDLSDDGIKLVKSKFQFKSRVKEILLSNLSSTVRCTRLLCPSCHLPSLNS